MHTAPPHANNEDSPPAAGRRSIAGLVAIVVVFVLGGLLLARVVGFGGGPAPTPGFMPVTTDIDSISFEAGKAGAPVVAVVTADWCPPCQQLKRTTLSDERVRAILVSSAQPVMIDGTDMEAATPTLQRLGVRVFPSTIILRDGQPVAMLEGFADPDKYLAWLEAQL